jgi:deoxycytidylate deaminase
MPLGCDDDVMPWARTAASPLDTKYPYVCHAELNAILNKNVASAVGCTLCGAWFSWPKTLGSVKLNRAKRYVALFPCNECAKLVIQSGIAHVVYCADKYHDDVPYVAARRMFDLAGVSLRCVGHNTVRLLTLTRSQFTPQRSRIVIDFTMGLNAPPATPPPPPSDPPAPASNVEVRGAGPAAGGLSSVSTRSSSPVVVPAEAAVVSEPPGPGSHARAAGDASSDGCRVM